MAEDITTYRGVDPVLKEAKELAIKELKARIKSKRDKIAKRMKRLENNDLKLTPAYQTWLKDGPKFMVKGKTPAQLKLIEIRLDEINDLKTSTAKGAKKYIEELGRQIGSQHTDLSAIQNEASNFYRLRDKLMELFDTQYNLSNKFGYGQVENGIEEYVKKNKIDLSDENMDVDALLADISELIDTSAQGTQVEIKTWYEID